MTLLHVHVNRNMYAPKFDNTNYEKTVLETQALGLPFIKVTARDQDNKVDVIIFYQTAINPTVEPHEKSYSL